jgi:hypothetical protein
MRLVGGVSDGAPDLLLLLFFSGTGTEGDCLASTGASIKVTTSIAGGCLDATELGARELHLPGKNATLDI